MGVLQRFERRLEDLVNRPFARAFKSEVEPVEIASALQREVDDRAAIVSRGRTMVPNAFVVELSPEDYERLSVYAEPLGIELASMVAEHVEEQRYALLGQITVAFERVDELETGRFRVRSSAVPDVKQRDRRRAAAAPASVPRLEVSGTTYPLTTPLTVIGRGTGVDLRIDDPQMSRKHAEVRLFEAPQGMVATVADLGSTNGTFVEGRRIERVELGDGMRIELGGTTLVFREGEDDGSERPGADRRGADRDGDGSRDDGRR